MYHSWLAQAYGIKAMNSNFIKKISLARKMRKECELAVKLDPMNVDARRGLMEIFLQAPKIVGGSTEKALHQAGEIIKIDSLEGLLAYGKIYQHSKDFNKAEHMYLNAITKFPKKETTTHRCKGQTDGRHARHRRR